MAYAYSKTDESFNYRPPITFSGLLADDGSGSLVPMTIAEGETNRSQLIDGEFAASLHNHHSAVPATPIRKKFRNTSGASMP